MLAFIFRCTTFGFLTPARALCDSSVGGSQATDGRGRAQGLSPTERLHRLSPRFSDAGLRDNDMLAAFPVSKWRGSKTRDFEFGEGKECWLTRIRT
jgi:hypothetical protein